MITADQLTEIGKFNSPHGINGEISATIIPEVDLAELRCIVVNMDGINVPFFINTVRPRNHTSLLITLDGITDEKQASEFTNKPIYALSDECLYDEGEDDDEEGFYAADLIGFKVKDTEGRTDGEIVDIDETTENVLFIVETSEGKRLMIPVADEYIESIDSDSKTITFARPDGFLDIYE